MNGVAEAPARKHSELTARIAINIIPNFVFIFFRLFVQFSSCREGNKSVSEALSTLQTL